MNSIFVCEKKKKYIAWLLLFTFFIQIFTPVQVKALGDGPTQPEVQSFEPAGTSQMVDLSTGSFNYNIPLMQIDGYPINIFYHSGITMDQEASCVGLGWNINPGSINRTLRGLPDDFCGDKLEKEMSMKKDITFGLKGGAELELVGFDKLKLGVEGGWFYNNNRGLGLEFGLSRCANITSKAQDKKSIGLGLSVNVNVNSQQGVSCDLGISPITSYSNKSTGITEITQTGIKGGLGFNSRTGLKQATLSVDFREYAPKTKSGFINNLPMAGKAQYSFSVPSYAPSMDFPRKSFAVSVKGTIGGAFTGAHPGINFVGYYSQLSLKEEIFTSNGYGTMYLERGTSGSSILDFNREKDGPYTPYLHNLSAIIPTPDVYTVSGQGIGGSYMLKRSDCGGFHDRRIVSNSESGNLSVEVGGGNMFHGGIDMSVVDNKNIVDKWTSRNRISDFFEFKKASDIDDPGYEPVYFKQAGELTADDDIALLQNLKDFEPISPVIDTEHDFDFGTSDQEIRVGPNDEKATLIEPLRTNRIARDRRNQNISYLTASEAKNVGVSTDICSYELYDDKNSNGMSVSYIPLNRIDDAHKNYHLSEITTLSAEGARYVYGIPAYNLSQEEYLFSVDGDNTVENGLIRYNDNVDDTRSNTAGKDHLYLKESTPPYAHSFLLTEVLSPDYADVDEKPGPSEQDYGNYVSIKYHKLEFKYKWRTPLHKSNNSDCYANHNEGMYSTKHDNKASYIYGEKEYWYVNSIEGKTQIAQFFYSQRDDALPVTDKSGKSFDSGNRLLKLDSIRLVSKDNLIYYNNFQTPVVPLVTVVFKYDYSLCLQSPNTTNPETVGKLKLRKLWFKYGKSQKGELSQYFFTYGNGDFGNPTYNQRDVSRWGGYQPTDASYGDLFPYVDQDKTKQDKYANAWNLTKIDLPTGGSIEIDYESNDYAYVQNKPAMQMIKILGIGNSSAFNSGNRLYDDFNSNYYLYFDLKKHYSSDQEVIRDFVKDILNEPMYFKFMVNLTQNYSDLIFGYTSIIEAGRCSDNDQIGYIKLKSAEFNSVYGSINPITKAAWQFLRISNPDLIYSIQGISPQNIDNMPLGVQAFLQLGNAIAGIASSLGEFIAGPNMFLHTGRWASTVDLSKCWVRLYEPNGMKLAGGSRVKRIVISDNFNEMADFPDGTTYNGTKYGQEFDYTKTITEASTNQTPVTRKISSGVASYEPIIGCDENPFRKPEFYDESHLLAPDNRFYQETPVGESFFPSPQIIYSKVSTRNLKFDANGNEGQDKYASTGETVNEYYTSYDYPTIVKQTRVDKQKKKTSLIFSLLKINMRDHIAVTQGICVDVNNMHGQPKSQWNYDENGNAVSGIEYYYNTNGNILNNKVKVIEKDGTLSEKYLGLEYSVSSDARQSSSRTIIPELRLNIDAFLVGIIPVVTVMPIPNIEKEETMFRSMTISKFIQRTGILIKTVVHDASSVISTENLAFDGNTGAVLLTKTSNEFNDPIFNLKLPAHFYYSGMDNACQNINVQGYGSLSQYNFNLVDLDTYDYFYPGDELLISNIGYIPGETKKAWLIDKLPPNTIRICDKQGAPVNLYNPNENDIFVKIIRSGHRNLASNEIAQFTTKSNPIVNNSIALGTFTNTCINSKITEYSDKWEWICKYSEDIYANKYNPFIRGVAGHWREKRIMNYLADRNSNFYNNVSPLEVKNTGTLNNFLSYYLFDGGSLIKNQNNSNWRWFEKTVKVDPNGNPVEAIDTLGHFSAQMSDHRTGKVQYKANNARYCEILASSFEDEAITYDRCFSSSMIPAFGLWQPVMTNSHTGKFCLTSTQPELSVYSGSYSYPITPYVDQTFNKEYDNSCNIFPLNLSDPVKSDPTLFLPIFHFTPNKKYLCSAWLKIGDDINAAFPEEEPYLKIAITNQDQITTQYFEGYPEGPSIDGWRRILFDFDVMNDYDQWTIKLIKPTEVSSSIYLDDFRIQPYDATMKSFVYDYRNNRLISELDENNYATFYEYDASGNLERIKKETENGIVTIKEVRANQSELHRDKTN